MEYTPIWSGIIACYLFLGGLGGGAFATSAFLAWRHPEAVTMRKLGHWIAPIVVIVGLVLLMFDAKAGLHNPLRFALLLTNFGSVMTWGVVILAATNRPEILDKALLRAGRFDRRIIVDRPNLAGRYQTLRVHTKNIKLAEDVDLHKIAQATAGAVGADLANLVNEAALRAVRLGRKAVNQQDLLTSFELVIAGTEKKGTVLTDTEKRIVSYHEVGHALVAALQKHSQPVSKITIVPHTSGALGYTMQMPEEEKFLSSKEELIVELQTMLGGRAAEQIVFGIATTGASNDIERATELARKMVTQYGMSDKLGLMALSTVSNPYLDGSTMMNCADSTSSAADEEIHKLLMDCYEDAKRLLTEHRALLDEIAMYLLTKETITGDEFMTYVNAENKKLTDGSEPAQDEQDAEAPASPDVPQEDAPSASD